LRFCYWIKQIARKRASYATLIAQARLASALVRDCSQAITNPSRASSLPTSMLFVRDHRAVAIARARASYSKCVFALPR